MTRELQGISSMATRLVLAELAQDWQRRGGAPVVIESVGGVDAAKRVAAGEALDVVFLAADAIDKLIASGQVLAGSRVDLFLSEVAVAVPAGAAAPDIATEQALRAAVLAAPSLSYSTGPSGTALAQLFERWGIAAQIKDRIVTPPPGVPVGSLLASAQVALGFQQRSEMMHLSGITMLGPLPAAVRIVTTFSAGVCARSAQPQAVRELLAFMASPGADAAKRREGMEPAPTGI